MPGMKKVNPLPPKIGYYLGSLVVFFGWIFNLLLSGYITSLRLLKLEHQRQKQGFDNLSSAPTTEREKWFYNNTISAKVEPDHPLQQNMSGDA